MKKPKLLFVIPLLLLSILPILPGVIRAHAATGTVCITDSATVVDATHPCPASQTLFASVGSVLTARVQISGSDMLNSLDVYVKADHSVLSAIDADLTGSILGSSTTILAKCVDGALITGSSCNPALDGIGVVHLAAAKTGGLVGGTGLLFTITYNTQALSPGTPISLIQVTIGNGTGTPDMENLVDANFSNQTDFAITASPSSLEIAPGVTGTTTITLTSFGGFTDFINFATTTTGSLTGSTSDPGLFLPPDSVVTTTLSVSSPSSGSFSATVTGTGTSITHSVTVPVHVLPPDFSVSASPSSITTSQGTTVSSTVSVTSIANLAGTVSLAATVSPAGPTATLNPTMVTLGATPATSTLTINVPTGTASGAYTVTVTGTGSTGMRSATVTLNVGVADFSINAVGNQIVVQRESPQVPAGTFFAIGSINNFAGTISLSTTVSFAFIDTPGSSTLPFTMATSDSLAAGATDTVPFSASVAKASAGTGMYLVTVTATSGSLTHVATLKIWVLDYAISVQDSVVTMPNVPGTFGQDPIFITALGTPHNSTGFNINPGLTSGSAAFPTQSSYVYSTSSGRLINETLGIDTSNTQRRCFLPVFDSTGALIKPTYSFAFPAGKQVVSFAAPLIHLNGDQDGDPPTFNGCRFDSLWYVDPVNGNGLGSTFDTSLVTIEPLTTTPNGVYTAQVCLQAGGDINCVSITVNLVPPPVAPSLNQFTGRTSTVSLAAGGQGNFKVGVTNNDLTQTVYVSVTITATSSDGKIVVTGTSGVVAITAGGKVNNIPISLDLSKVPAGTTLNENLVINYGVAAHYTTLASTSTVGTSLKLTGSIVVTP